FLGVIQVEEGLYRSRNVPTLLLAQDIGFSRIWQFAKHLGLTDTMRREWTITLGSAETTVIKMASAYIAMLNGGDVKLATTIKQVTDLDGNLLIVPSEYLCVGCREESEFSTRMKSVSEARLVIPPEASRTLRTIMRKVMTQGTGYRLGRDLPRDVIGKTGTTNHARDAWFIGHTTSLGPDPLLIATYIGYDQPQPISRGASGARIAGSIFRDVVLGTLNGDVDIRNKPTEQIVQKELYRTVSPLNFRSAKSTSSRVLAVMPKNANLLNVSCSGSWCGGEFKGQKGYFSKRYVKRVNGGGLVTVSAEVPDRFRDLRRFMAASGGTYTPNPNSNAIQTANSASTPASPFDIFGNTRASAQVTQPVRQLKKKAKRTVVRIIDGVEVSTTYNF
ncbi:MAG: penicillin-binding transpeptidase domain-containing protein, partial [Alphaproteobacteria bacterium]